MSDIRVDDEVALDEHIRAAFAKPVEGGELMPLPQTNLAITDAIITAQKVAVARDETRVLAKIKTFAQAAGSEWYFRWPVAKRGGGQDWIEGPSIKCANNVARYYGNCQIDTRIVDNGDSWIVYAKFVDYETGFSYTRPFQQRKNQQGIKSADMDRQRDIALQIGVSKAIRNVICNALEPFTTFAFEEARSAIVDRVGKELEKYRERVLDRLDQMKVSVERVEISLGRPANAWLAPDIAKIIALIQAVNDGMATADETWPRHDAVTGEVQEGKTSQLDKFDQVHGGGAKEEGQPAAAEGKASRKRKPATNAAPPASPSPPAPPAETSAPAPAAEPEVEQTAEPAETDSEPAREPGDDADEDTSPREPVERASIWDQESFQIPLPTKAGNAPNFQLLRDHLIHFSDQADSAAELIKFIDDNETHLRRLKDFSAGYDEAVRQHFMAVGKRLASGE